MTDSPAALTDSPTLAYPHERQVCNTKEVTSGPKVAGLARWRAFHQTVREARRAFADVPPDELQKMIDEAVKEIRAKHYRKRPS